MQTRLPAGSQYPKKPPSPAVLASSLLLVPPVPLGRQSGLRALQVESELCMTEAVCKTGHTEHLAAFGRVQYQSKQGMEALHTPIISIRHRVSLICSFQVQIWRYSVLISSLNISAQGPFFPTADTLLILILYHHPLSVIFSA